MTDLRVNRQTPRDLQARRLRLKHGLTPRQADNLARWHFGEEKDVAH